MKRACTVVLIVLIALPLAAAAPAAAQGRESANTLRLDDSAASPPAKIGELSWLAGYWRGEGLGGSCEEIWSRPEGDRMLGIFSLRKEGEIVFWEAMELVEEGGSVVLKVKHFTPEFVGWEEKDKYVTFPLVRLGDREAYFRGLTFRRKTDDMLSIYLVLSKEGEKTEHELRFERLAF